MVQRVRERNHRIRSQRACRPERAEEWRSDLAEFSRPCRGVSVFVLVPKVSEALWERTREAKLRFGGERERKRRD